MLIINADIVSIDFRILFGKLKPDENQKQKPHKKNIIAAFLSELSGYLKASSLEGAAFLLEKGFIPYWVLTLLLKEVAKIAKIYGIELSEDTFYIDSKYKQKDLSEVEKMLNISVSIEDIDAKKLVALAQAQAPALADTTAEIDIAAVLSVVEPHADNILNAFLPALPDVVSVLEEYIKSEAAKRGITLSDLKVSL